MDHLKYLAISNLYQEVGRIEENGDAFHKDTKEKIKIDKNLVEQEFQRLKLEEQANQYQRDRAVAYPSIQDQLDMQYHDLVDGTTTWKDAIAKEKADNPKPK